MGVGENNRVLVIGDWYVDAHWVVAPHESDTASRIGESQYLSVHGIDATVRALCGAGQVANLLHQANRKSAEPEKIEVYGAGSWASKDDEFIEALMIGANSGDNPSHLKPKILTAETKGRVYNITTGGGQGTNRVVRIYRQTSPTDYAILHRIDFETQSDMSVNEDEFSKWLQDKLFTHVIIKDHGHGIINDKTISILTRACKNAHYYVSTKQWHPLWLHLIKGDSLRLLLLQSEACSQASTGDLLIPSVTTWFTENNIPTLSGLSAIDKLRDELSKQKITPNCITTLPTRNTLISNITKKTRKSRNTGLILENTVERAPESFMPRSSALFAAICFYDIDSKSHDRDWQHKISDSIAFTNEWVSQEAGRITDRNWTSNKTKLQMMTVQEIIPGLYAFDWDKASEQYWTSLTAWNIKNGVIGTRKNGDIYQIDIWRGMCDVKKVISITARKRYLLGQLSGEISKFVKGNRKHHKSYYIIDDPGGGKSTMIKAIAESSGMHMLQANLTEFTNKHDLLSFFDTIVTAQAQQPKTPLLVFVDEINALIDGQPAYSAFLAPLEDGHYNRDGKSFTIQPCVWVFAGTGDSHPSRKNPPVDFTANTRTDTIARELEEFINHYFKHFQDDNSTLHSQDNHSTHDRSQKESDFLSRLSLPPFYLNQPFMIDDSKRESVNLKGALTLLKQALVEGRHPVEYGEVSRWRKTFTKSDVDLANQMVAGRILNEGKTLERVYVGVYMLQRARPDVTHISMKVLAGLALLDEAYTLRDIRHDFERLTNVQRGQVKWDNLPPSFHNRLGYRRVEMQIDAQIIKVTALTEKRRLLTDILGHSIVDEGSKGSTQDSISEMFKDSTMVSIKMIPPSLAQWASETFS